MCRPVLVVTLLLSLLAAPTQAQQSLAAQSLDTRVLLASPTTLAADPALTEHVRTLAETTVVDHCAACHGADLQGREGVPNLVDYEWLWGVTGTEMTPAEPVLQIMQTILYGIRDTDCPEDSKRYGACPDTRYSEMPAYQDLGFSASQIDDLVDYVLSLSGEPHDAAALARVENLVPLCVECHGEGAYGYRTYGGPDLTDAVWLYGGSREQIRDVIANGRKGTCPAWSRVLDPVTIKALALYLYGKATGL